jgi:hypothetical protein
MKSLDGKLLRGDMRQHDEPGKPLDEDARLLDAKPLDAKLLDANLFEAKQLDAKWLDEGTKPLDEGTKPLDEGTKPLPKVKRGQTGEAGDVKALATVCSGRGVTFSINMSLLLEPWAAEWVLWTLDRPGLGEQLGIGR